eukprot:12050818-Alexandrium_andersonii.AAC.1
MLPGGDGEDAGPAPNDAIEWAGDDGAGAGPVKFSSRAMRFVETSNSMIVSTSLSSLPTGTLNPPVFPMTTAGRAPPSKRKKPVPGSGFRTSLTSSAAGAAQPEPPGPESPKSPAETDRR